MCIALYWISSQGKYKFILLFNREEFSDRPTEQLNIIHQTQYDLIFAGKDKLGSGTWLGLNISNGNIAFLTNRNLYFSHTFQQQFTQLQNYLRSSYPKICKLFYPPLLSRGQLILDLLCGSQEPQSYTYTLDPQKLICHYNQIQITKELIKSKVIYAYLKKNNYMGFNLFVGNILQNEYYSLSSTTGTIQQIKNHGTVSSLSNIGEYSIEKENIAKQKFIKIIQEDQQDIFESLFNLAQEQFQSTETMFKCIPEESHFFIPEYIAKNGKKRGTRTTTIIIFDGNTIQMREKTYI